MTSIFLSYARGDDGEPFDPVSSFVARLHRDLTAAGFVVWYDRISMPSRGLTFHQEIRDAIVACDRLLLLVGPRGGASDYVQQEWQFAWFEAEKVVTPILRRGDYPLVPDELKLLHCEDFRDDDQYSLHLANLVRQLSEAPPPLGKLIGVPSLPPHYLSRTDRLIPLRDAVRSGLDSPAPFGGAAALQKFHGIAGTSKTVGMHGMGGIGKSVLANLLAHDRQIREAFPDGIAWVSLGSTPNLADLMRHVHKELGGDGVLATELEGKAKLKALLADKALLLIIDDVWNRRDADAFDVLGPRCRALITTRDAGLLTALGGTQHVVELLTDAEALRLLAVAANVDVTDMPPEAIDIVSECGRLPLAVALCGALVRRRTWQEVLDQLRQARIDRIADRHAIEAQHQDVWRAIHVSVAALQPHEKARFLELAVFPPDEVTPEAAAATLWEHTGGLDDWDAGDLLTSLVERSLVQLITSRGDSGQSPREFTLHDLVHDYLRNPQTLQESLVTLRDRHAQLLAAYRAKCSAGWHTGPRDGYFFQHLRRHLIDADSASDAFQLLLDFEWLGAKTRAGLAFDLALDFRDAHRCLSVAERAEFLPWYYFARHNAPFLAAHPECYFQQAYNEPVNSPVSRAARQRWEAAGGQASSGARPDELPAAFLEWTNRPVYWEPPACLMTLSGHTGYIVCLAVTPDGGTVVSGASDQTVRIWDAQTGACRHTLSEHSKTVGCVAVTPDGGTVVSGSWDQSIKVWNAHTGECRRTISGYDGSLTCLTVSPDVETIVCGLRQSSGSTIEVLSARTGNRRTLEGPPEVYSVAVTPDGRIIMAGGTGVVRTWNLETQQHVDLPTPGDPLQSITVNENGTWILGGPNQKQFGIWDAVNKTLRSSPEGIGAQKVAIDGRGTVAVFDSHFGWTYLADDQNPALRFGIGILDFEALAERVPSSISLNDIKAFSGHTGPIQCLAVSRDGSVAVSGSFDKTVRVWDLQAPAGARPAKHHFGGVNSVRVSDDGTTFVSWSMEENVRQWDPESGLGLGCFDELASEASRLFWDAAPTESHVEIRTGCAVFRSSAADEGFLIPGQFTAAGFSPRVDLGIAGDGEGQVYLFAVRRRRNV